MDVSVVSWDGHFINDGALWTATLPKGLRDQPSSEPIFISMGPSYPIYGGKELASVTLALVVEVLGEDIARQVDLLKSWFQTPSLELKKLVVRDRATGKLFYVYGTAIGFTPKSEFVTIILALDSPIWRCETALVDDFYMTASSVQRIGVTKLGGSAECEPVFELTPDQAKSGGFAYGRWWAVYNTADRAWVNVGIDVVNAGLDTLALYNAGKMQYSGNDMRLFIDGQEAHRSIARLRQANSGVWTAMSFEAGISVTIKTGFSSTDTVTEIEVENTRANREALAKLVKKNKPLIFFSAGEAIACLDVNLSKRKLTGVVTGVKKTIRANHTAGERFWWVEHDVVTAYGNPSLGAPDTDSSKAPMFDVDQSTNANHVYTQFWEQTGLRVRSWVGEVVRSSGVTSSADASSGDLISSVYTAIHETDADPATVMGMVLKSYQRSGRWQAENGSVECSIEEPFGVTAVSANGEKKRGSTSWPSLAGLQKSKNGTTFTTVWSESNPASTAWAAWTRSGVSLGGTFYHLKFALTGTVAAGATGVAHFEVDSVTLALDSTKIPMIAGGQEWSNYELDLTITNLANGKSIRLGWTLAVGQTLVVDCSARTVMLRDDNTNALSARSLSSDRLDWLDLAPGDVRLQFDDVGTTQLHVISKFLERML